MAFEKRQNDKSLSRRKAARRILILPQLQQTFLFRLFCRHTILACSTQLKLFTKKTYLCIIYFIIASCARHICLEATKEVHHEQKTLLYHNPHLLF